MRQRCCLVSFSIFVIFTLLQTKLIRRIALEGADVTIVFMPEEKVDAEESLRDFSEKSKGRSKVVLAAFDLRDELNCGTLVEMHLNERGKLDVLYLSDIEATYGRSQHEFLCSILIRRFSRGFAYRAMARHVPHEYPPFLPRCEGYFTAHDPRRLDCIRRWC